TPEWMLKIILRPPRSPSLLATTSAAAATVVKTPRDFCSRSKASWPCLPRERMKPRHSVPSQTDSIAGAVTMLARPMEHPRSSQRVGLCPRPAVAADDIDREIGRSNKNAFRCLILLGFYGL